MLFVPEDRRRGFNSKSEAFRQEIYSFGEKGSFLPQCLP